MNDFVPLEVVVTGDFACFTRPENKVERVSYPVMTPSAARGVLEAIYWKPEFSWRVLELHVLREIRQVSLLRNEIEDRQLHTGKTARGDPGGNYLADEHRAQRHTLALRGVAYLIRAEQVLRPHETKDIAKHRDCFRRRVQSGQCFQQPYLGCREFAAEFRPPNGSDKPVDLTMDLGPMLFDLRYEHDKTGKGIGATPVFFDARLENGVLKVPQGLYEEVEGHVS